MPEIKKDQAVNSAEQQNLYNAKLRALFDSETWQIFELELRGNRQMCLMAIGAGRGEDSVRAIGGLMCIDIILNRVEEIKNTKPIDKSDDDDNEPNKLGADLDEDKEKE